MKFVLAFIYALCLVLGLFSNVEARRDSKIGPQKNKRDCEADGLDWSAYGCLKGFKRIEGSAEEVQKRLELEARKYYRKLRSDEKRKRRLARRE